MTSSGCRRSWQVEAARDGHLSGAELRNFELHVAQCKACARERRELEQLSRDLRKGGELPDDVTLRRGRDRLLEHAHRIVYGIPQRRATFAWLAAAALASVAAAAMLVHHTRTPEATVVPLVDVVASRGAKWERDASRAVEEIRLAEGTFTLTIHRKNGDPPVLFVVPDGSIEDVGTTFQVTVEGGHTRAVVVREGAVRLHLEGHPDELVRSPGTWTASPVPKEPEARTSAPASKADARAPSPPTTSIVTRASTSATPPRPPAVVASGAVSEEDLAYLRIVSLSREGRVADARAAATRYLRAFPDGFRRKEVLAFTAQLRSSDVDSP